MQVDHPGASGRLMQPVHILGQKDLAPAHGLEPGQGAMRSVRSGAANASPSDKAARPIAPARRFVAHEGLIGHRLLPLPLTVGVAIVGNARARAAAGAGQDEETSMPLDEVLETAAFRHEIRLPPNAQSRHGR